MTPPTTDREEGVAKPMSALDRFVLRKYGPNPAPAPALVEMMRRYYETQKGKS